MALYRETATGFVQEHASNPGSGYTLISSQPTDTVANRVNWWRDVDKGSFTSAWHPSLQTGSAENPGEPDGAGRGVNILPNDYVSFEWPAGLPPTHVTNATISQQSNHIHGNYCARVTLSSAGGVAWLSASGAYNIVLEPNQTWIMSWYVKPTTAVARTASIKLVTANGTYTVSGTTDGSTSWQRLSGLLDLSADAATDARIGLSLDTTGVALDFDGLMLEQQIGRESNPSPFYSPWGFGATDKPEYWPDYGIPAIKLYSDLQARINLIDGASSLDGSVNKRLADQYTTLVQQINQVAVGNGQFDSKQIWYFDTSADITGWTNGGCTLAVTGGYLIVTGTGSTPYFRTSTLAIDGAAYQLIRMRVKRTAGTGWTGTLTYYYGASSSGTKTISVPTNIDSAYIEADWDMSADATYKANTITGIRIQLGTGSGDTFSIDWMGVGRNAPGASYSQLEVVRVLSDNKNRVFYETYNPTSTSTYTLKTNDLLFRTDQGNKPYRWSGTAWVETTDTRLADSWAEIYDIANSTASPSGAAAQRINGISAAASKTRTYYLPSTTAPTGMVTGDLWFKTDLDNRAFRYSGSAWVETTDTRITTLQASVANKEEAKVGYCSISPGTNTTRALCLAAGGTWTDQPFATAVKQVSVTNANGTASIETNLSTLATDTGSLKTQYSVKLDVNGYVAGFGLYNAGAGASGFLINADKFAIGKPGATTVIPFYVDATANTAYINNAVIKNLTATNIQANSITADRIDSRGLSIKDASGNVILAAGTGLSSGYISAGLGGNQFPNADIGAGIDNWAVGWVAGGGTNYAIGWDLAGESWVPAGGHVVGAVRYGNTQSATGWFDVYNKKTFPIIAGKRYEFSAYLASHRCDVSINVGWYKLVNGVETYVTESSYPASPRSSGGQELGNWTRAGGFVTAPTGATYAKVWIRGSAVDTGQNDPFFWATRIFFGEATATQTELTPWSLAGGSGPFSDLNQITASNASTYIANAAIDKAQIGSVNADTITTGTLNASLVNVTNLNAGSITTGTLNGKYVTVTNLNASNITTGTLNCANFTVTNLNANSITTGTISGYTVSITDLRADKITVGTLVTSQIGTNQITKIIGGQVSRSLPNTFVDGSYGSSGYANFSTDDGDLIVTASVSMMATVIGSGKIYGDFYLEINGTVRDARRIYINDANGITESSATLEAYIAGIGVGTQNLRLSWVFNGGQGQFFYSWHAMNGKR